MVQYISCLRWACLRPRYISSKSCSYGSIRKWFYHKIEIVRIDGNGMSAEVYYDFSSGLLNSQIQCAAERKLFRLNQNYTTTVLLGNGYRIIGRAGIDEYYLNSSFIFLLFQSFYDAADIPRFIFCPNNNRKD